MFNIVIKGAGASHYYFSLEDLSRSVASRRCHRRGPLPFFLLALPRFFSILTFLLLGLKNPREN